MEKKSSFTKQRFIVFFYIIVLLAGIFHSMDMNKDYVDVFAMPASGKVVVIDAGHGGWAGGGYS